jgi:DNA-binding NarL/FixJ family response regulator
MISIVYLEEKILIRTAFVLAFEKQEGCKVVYAAQCVETFIIHIQKQKLPPDLCILSDAYCYTQLARIIKVIKSKSNHCYILLKSEEQFMKGICFLLRSGLNGFFFTDEPLIDLQQYVYQRTKFKITTDKLKLIVQNKKKGIQIKELEYNTEPLTQKEIEFIQACVRDESYEQIAARLQKTVKTIYGYRDRIFKKLQVKQRTAMVMTALKRNYIDL